MKHLDIEKFRNADRQLDPFQYVIVPEVISADHLKEINADFPAIKKAGNFRIHDLTYGPHFKALLEDLMSPAFQEAIEEKFDVSLEGLDHLISIRAFSHRTDGNIHTDVPAKILTALLYLNDDWSSDGGRLRILRGPKDMDDFVEEVPPVLGTLLVFKRSNNSWHGHKPCVEPRRTIQINWVTDPAAASKQYRPVTPMRKAKQWLGLEAVRRRRIPESIGSSSPVFAGMSDIGRYVK